MNRGGKEGEPLEKQFWFKTSDESQNVLMVPLQSRATLSPRKFSSEINSGRATLIKFMKHKSNDVQIAAQMLAKPCREVLIMNKLSLTSTDFTYTITSNYLRSNRYNRAKWRGRPKTDTTAQATTTEKPTKVRSKKNNRAAPFLVFLLT